MLSFAENVTTNITKETICILRPVNQSVSLHRITYRLQDFFKSGWSTKISVENGKKACPPI